MLKSLLRMSVRHRWTGLIVIVATVVLGLGVTGKPPLEYGATARIVFAAHPGVTRAELEEAANFVRSDAVLERAIRDHLSAEFPAGSPDQLAHGIGVLRSTLQVDRPRDSRSILISSTALFPSWASRRVLAVAQAFGPVWLAHERQATESELRSVERRLEPILREEAEIRRAGDRSGLPDSDGSELARRVAAARLAELEGMQGVERLESASLAAQIETLSGRIERGDLGPGRAVSTAESDRIAEELAFARRRLEEARTAPGEDPALVARLSGRVDELIERRAQAIQREIQAARFSPLRELIEQIRDLSARRERLENGIAQRNLQIAQLRTAAGRAPGPTAPPTPPGRQEGLGAGRASALAQVRASLEKERDELEGRRDRGERSLAPVEPPFPARLSGAAAPILLGVGLLLGFLATGLKETLSVTIRTEQDVRRYVNLPLLATVPLVRAPADRTLVSESDHAPLTETFSALAALLERHGTEEPSKTCAITSAAPGEGKSTLACNLAIALARGGSQVLLLDADLRKGIQHQYFGLPGDVGLSSYLQGSVDTLESTLMTPAVGNLTFVSAGPPLANPIPYLRSERFKALMNEVRERFDYVILDLPPVRDAADALHVAPLADQSLLIAAVGRTRKDDVTLAKRRMRAAGAKLFGCVLNMAGIPTAGYYFYTTSLASRDE
jgi:capsular exopolysaccharide synthesis family protein